jgi:hypothetical protein
MNLCEVASFISVPLLAVLFFVSRLWPIWRQRNQGCDAYYFLMCAEAFHNNRRIPIVLPGLYLLEPDEQWYPPLFPVFIGLLPQHWLKEKFWLLDHLADFVVMLGLFFWTSYSAGLAWAWAVGAIYAFEPNLVSEYRSLTSRPLSVILFLALMMAGKLGADNGWQWTILASLIGMLIFYSHKLTMQLLCFLLPFLAWTAAESRWIFVLGGAYLMAIIFGRGMFVKVLRAHWDIVQFWFRNWPWLGAHQVRHSPVYGTGNPGGFHEGRGVKLLVLHAKRLFIANPWVLPAGMTALLLPHLKSTEVFFLLAVTGIYIWAVATLLIPWLRCLGEGTKYTKYAEPLALLLCASVISHTGNVWLSLMGLVCLCVQVWHYARITMTMRLTPSAASVMSRDLLPIIELLMRDPDARVMCLPLHLSDLIAYHSQRPVLWGTHGYGFRNVEPIFPVFRQPIERMIDQYKIKYLLLDMQFADPKEVGFDEGREVLLQKGRYAVFSCS